MTEETLETKIDAVKAAKPAGYSVWWGMALEIIDAQAEALRQRDADIIGLQNLLHIEGQRNHEVIGLRAGYANELNAMDTKIAAKDEQLKVARDGLGRLAKSSKNGMSREGKGVISTKFVWRISTETLAALETKQAEDGNV